MNVETFCRLFYASHYLPVALFRDGNQEQVFSSLDRPLDIYHEISSHIQELSENWELFDSVDSGQYGMIRIEHTEQILVVGPVFSMPVTERMVSAYARCNGISNRDWSLLYWFLAGIPRYTYTQFVNMMQYLDYLFNSRITESSKWLVEDFLAARQPEAVRQRDAMYNSWELNRHETFAVESMILAYIREGDVEKLQKFLSTLGKVANLKEGKVADSPLRQAKNIFIGLLCVVGKTAAIPGGMDDENAYFLMDIYSQECERAATVGEIKLLQYNMLIDFAQRVAREKLPEHLSPKIAQCVQFLREHPTGDVGIDEAAGFVGMSRAWLTRQFKKEMGQSLGEYQTYQRLQEGKRLLRFSNASLIEIANSLGFSSQAHFQTVFKKATGMTPREYRKKEN